METWTFLKNSKKTSARSESSLLVILIFFPHQVPFTAFYILENWVMLFSLMRVTLQLWKAVMVTAVDISCHSNPEAQSGNMAAGLKAVCQECTLPHTRLSHVSSHPKMLCYFWKCWKKYEKRIPVFRHYIIKHWWFSLHESFVLSWPQLLCGFSSSLLI